MQVITNVFSKCYPKTSCCRGSQVGTNHHQPSDRVPEFLHATNSGHKPNNKAFLAPSYSPEFSVSQCGAYTSILWAGTHFVRMLINAYIYWTVHHLDSWIKRDQLDVTCFIISLFNAQHVSDVNTSILRSLQLICWVISWVVILWFDVCWCYVVVWLGWCGIRMQASACIRIPHHPSQTTT